MSDLAERYFEQALTAVRHHNYDRAASLLIEAIKIKPDFTEAWVVRGNVLHASDRFFDSILHYDRALALNDRLHDAWNNRGIAFADIGMWDAAEDSFRKSLAQLDAMEPYMGLATMYCTLNRLPDAAAAYRSAIERGAGPDAHFNLGCTLLGMGQWEEGFREYEYRWRNTPYPPRAYRNFKKWRGEALNNKRLLLYPEQGYGDEIMALRFASDIQALYPRCRVIIQARAPMLRLVQQTGVVVMPMNGNDRPRIDYSCPLLDVPMVMGLTPDKVRCGRYISADPKGVAEWRSRVDQLPPGLNVGLCWSSGGHLNTARAAQMAKSIPLPWLKPLAMPGVNLISLQVPRETIPPDMPVIDWMADVHDFADTTALIETLDLVITVDTAVAHLAGAMGKPVWNFVRSSGYWPWLTPEAAGSPDHSIWYPSMKLIRQPSLANWAEPIEHVTDMLAQMVEAKAAA